MVYIFKCSHQDQSWWGKALTKVLLWFVLAQLVTSDGPTFQKHSAGERRKERQLTSLPKWEMLLFIIVCYKVWRGGVVALRVPSWWLEDGGGGWCTARRLSIWKTAEELDLTQTWKYFSSQTAIKLSSRLVSKPGPTEPQRGEFIFPLVSSKNRGLIFLEKGTGSLNA